VVGSGRDHRCHGPDDAPLAGTIEADGYSGLADRRKGRPSEKRVPLATVEEVLRFFRETYFDLNIRHFHEKLRERHGVKGGVKVSQ
jgi:hypothetical protein